MLVNRVISFTRLIIRGLLLYTFREYERGAKTVELLAIYLAAGLMIGLGGLGAAIGVGILASKLLEACARQPELAQGLQVRYYIVMTTIDVIPMIGLAVGLYLIFAVA